MILFTQFYNVILGCFMKENSKRELELTKSEDRPWAQLGSGVLGQPFSAIPNKNPTLRNYHQTPLGEDEGCRPLLNILTIPRG